MADVKNIITLGIGASPGSLMWFITSGLESSAATLTIQDCLHSHWADGPIDMGGMPGDGYWTILYTWKRKRRKRHIIIE